MTTLHYLSLESFSPEIDHIARLMSLADGDSTEAQEALAFLLSTNKARFIHSFWEQLACYADAYGGSNAETALLRRRQFGRLANGNLDRIAEILSLDESGLSVDHVAREVLIVAHSYISGRVSDPAISRERTREVIVALEAVLEETNSSTLHAA